MQTLTFTSDLLARRRPTGIDVDTTLAHFAIITYRVEPNAIRPLIDPRFEPDLIEIDGRQFALLSVVPFMDLDFRFAKAPWPKWRFGQTNYRIYVTDTKTGEHAAWFLGTSLDSRFVAIPSRVWKLPWHRADIEFNCTFDPVAKRYIAYQMRTTNSWADAFVELEDSGAPPQSLSGFDDLESGMVLLTHPRKGYYFRSDGRLGSYSIWHDRLRPNVGRAKSARFELLDQMEIVASRDTSQIHSVLIQDRTDFTIYLPPRVEE